MLCRHAQLQKCLRTILALLCSCSSEALGAPLCTAFKENGNAMCCGLPTTEHSWGCA